MSRVSHGSVTLSRRYTHPPARVFAAFADPAARMRWSAPAGDAIVFDAADFRVGGQDRFRCGPPPALDYVGDIRYEDIVAERRILFVETVSHRDTRLSSALCTVELQPDDAGTRLDFTAQIACLADKGMIDSYRAGWRLVLDQLETELEGRA